jgi:cytochrome oxidase Cu insertion factor (SCO1/SenC/PrrC family)
MLPKMQVINQLSIKIAVLCSLFFIQFSLIAHGQKKHQVIISGLLKGDVSSVKAIRLIFNSEDQYDIKRNYDTAVTPTQNGYFSFALPIFSHFGKIKQLVVIYKKMINEVSNDHDILDDYIVERSDSINMAITVEDDWVTKIDVSGNGSAKYQCRSAIVLEYYKFRSNRIKVDKSLGADWWNIENLQKIIEPYSNSSLAMFAELETYRNNITPFVYKIMEADAISSIRFLWELQIADYYQRIDSAHKEGVRDFYLNHNFKEEHFENQVLAYSPNYVSDYLYQRELNLIAFAKKISVQDISFHDIYYMIKNKYTGELRELLLMLLIVDPFKNYKLTEMDTEYQHTFINDALTVIKNPALKMKIENTSYFLLKKGEAAYNFILPDTSGKMISLNDLKGNVVLMDMWFTGCTGCVMFAEKFKKEIKYELENDSNFIIVSICTDNDRNSWLKSLYSGKYSETNNINLHLPQGKNYLEFFKIPMIKHYNINALPFILLIDKNGKIISQFTNRTEAIIIRSMIQESLEKK